MPSKITSQTEPPSEIHRLKSELAELRRQYNEALAARAMDEDYGKFILRALHAKFRQPDWTLMPRARSKHLVMPVSNFSDWHLDERVNPAEIQNRNGYDRPTALRRLRYYFSNLRKVAKEYVKGFNYPGIVMNFLGDNFSGFIHEELRRTNEATMFESMLYWVPEVKCGLRMLAEEFGRVWVTCVVGNHGRYDKKPIAKMRAHENFDWLFVHLIKMLLEAEGEKRVTFLISNGQKLRFNIFDTRVITSHGDECKGGSGIAGMLSPQLIAFSRMKKTFEFDQWWFGHWHSLAAYRGMRCNGSGKGYDEFASTFNFDFQVPLQDFFLVAPKHGVISSWPIHCQLPEEPWAQQKTESAAPFKTL